MKKQTPREPVKILQTVLRAGMLAALSGVSWQVQAVPVFLGPTAYTSFTDSPFKSGKFDYFHLENFEDGKLNTPGVHASAGAVAPPDRFTDSVDADDGLTDGSGLAGHSWFSQNTNRLTFTFDVGVLGRLPTHAGIVWTDVGDVGLGGFGYGLVLFQGYDAAGDLLGSIDALVGDGVITGQTAEDRFFGVVDAGGISRIVIEMANSTDWEIDHLQYGAASSPKPVPEPTTLGLLSTGLAGLGWVRKRGQKAT